MAYCWDTSAFIHSWVRTSPPDIFVTLWQRLDAEIMAGNIVSPEEVYVELERQEGDLLLEWVRARRSSLITALQPDIQAKVTEIGATFPDFVSGDGDRNLADPWVIGLSMARGLTVVTSETRPGSPDSPTIPRVCTHFGVPLSRYVRVHATRGLDVLISRVFEPTESALLVGREPIVAPRYPASPVPVPRQGFSRGSGA